jgi:c-di-GMP-binding flagellar brake protein YcgR
MSTQIKRIEKEYFLSKLISEQIPVVYIFNRQDFIFKVDKITKESIEFITARTVEGLVPNKRLNLMFDYKGLVISFNVEIKQIKEEIIITTIPEVLYKNLDRANSRVSVPNDLQIELISLEDRYSLPFPKSLNFEALDESAVVPNIDPKNFNAIVDEMARDLKEYIDGYKLVYFNATVKPEKVEECVIAESGKILFIPSTDKKLPDFAPEKKFITNAIFQRYFESIGVGQTFVNQTIDQFMKSKRADGIASAMWVPLCFQEYVIGYIYVWKKIAERMVSRILFDEALGEKLYRYGKCLVLSLSQRGYFEAGRMKDRVINGKAVDISASGIRFAVPNSFLFANLQPGVEVGINMSAPGRTINARLRIRRRYKEGSLVFLGCSFLDMTPADGQFLFEVIYGKSSAITGNFVSGNV